MYTEETTTKTIYVGTDKHLMALSNNLLTIEALNEKIEQGATISDNGTITDYVPPVEPEPEPSKPPAPEEPEPQPVVAVDTPVGDVPLENPSAEVPDPVIDETPQSSFSTLLTAVASVAIVGGVIVALVIVKRAKKKKEGGLT